MTMAKIDSKGYELLYARAVLAGRLAAVEAEKGMAHYAVMQGSKQVGLLHGLCGFAWVVVKDRSLGYWLKKAGHGRTGYGGGVHLWISEHGQSHEMKTAHARAMAEVFSAAGYSAYAGERLD
jgi:hypothetical protein